LRSLGKMNVIFMFTEEDLESYVSFHEAIINCNPEPGPYLDVFILDVCKSMWKAQALVFEHLYPHTM
jgi:hypothetical protein